MTNIGSSARPLPTPPQKQGQAPKIDPPNPPEAEGLIEKTQRKASELLDQTYNKATSLFDQTPKKAGRMLEQAQSYLLANEDAQQSFMEGLDTDSDGQVSNTELRKQMDSNKDGYLDSSEIEQLALKARASDIDQSTIQVLAQSVNLIDPIILFDSEEVEILEAVSVEPETAESSSETKLKQTTPEQEAAQTATDSIPQKQTPAASPHEDVAVELPTVSIPTKKVWSTSDKMAEHKASDRTVIPVHRDILPSRDLSKLTAAKAGLFHIQDQVGNSCGTTSLSMLMKFYQGHSLENSVPTIDKYIRGLGTFELHGPNGNTKSYEIDSYTAPRDIVDYANERGFRAGLQNNSSISKLTAFLDKGVPVMVLTDWNFDGNNGKFPAGAKPDGESLHYVNVIGYEHIKPEGSKESKLHLVIANPHGKIQYVPEDQFNKVWSNVKLKIGSQMIDTGFNKMMIAMVPKDEAATITAPDGKVRKAGEISVPSGSDGITGWIAQKGSEIVKATAEIQENIGQRGGQLIVEAQKGYQEDGVMGALANLWRGDQSEIDSLRKMAKTGSPATRAVIINQLLDKGINRSNVQTLIYDIMRESPWGKDFNTLVDSIDVKKIAERIESDAQAGKIMSWLAKSEVDRTGKTGPKFEAFASHMANQHRDGAVNTFLESKYTQDQKLVQKMPATLVRNMVNQLMSGITDSGEEKAIYGLLKNTAPAQFDTVLSRLNMARVAEELESASQLGNLSAWVIDSAAKTGHWGPVSEILNRLEATTEYTRADDVLGNALQHSSAKDDLSKIPSHLRRRMIDLLDDITRLRSDKAVAALRALKSI